MTPPHSPLPWTVNEVGDIIDADGAEMVIAEDGAIYPEDRRLIVTAVNNHARLSCDLATARRETDEMRRSYAICCAGNDKLFRSLAAARREKEEMRAALASIARQKTHDELSEDEKEYADFEGAYDVMIATARALAAQPDPHKEGVIWTEYGPIEKMPEHKEESKPAQDALNQHLAGTGPFGSLPNDPLTDTVTIPRKCAEALLTDKGALELFEAKEALRRGLASPPSPLESCPGEGRWLREALEEAQSAKKKLLDRHMKILAELSKEPFFSYSIDSELNNELLDAAVAIDHLKALLLLAASPSVPAPAKAGDGWVKVDEEHPLPSDLKENDEVRHRLEYRRRPSAEQGG